MTCVSVDRERKPDLTASTEAEAQKRHWFCFISIHSLSKWPPELFINTGILAEKDLPTSKGGRGTQETQCWSGNCPSAHRKSAQMSFVSVSHPPGFFFSPWGEQLACQQKTGGPHRAQGLPPLLGKSRSREPSQANILHLASHPCGGPYWRAM